MLGFGGEGGARAQKMTSASSAAAAGPISLSCSHSASTHLGPARSCRVTARTPSSPSGRRLAMVVRARRRPK